MPGREQEPTTKYHSFSFDICFYMNDYCLQPVLPSACHPKKAGFVIMNPLFRFIKAKSGQRLLKNSVFSVSQEGNQKQIRINTQKGLVSQEMSHFILSITCIA